jgi:hypothetical protein
MRSIDFHQGDKMDAAAPATLVKAAVALNTPGNKNP